MPISPIKPDATKKHYHLLKREYELQQAIKSKFSAEKLIKVVEKFRASQLSYLKAELHVIREKQFQVKPYHLKKENIEAQIEIWKNKTHDEIIYTINQGLIHKNQYEII